MPLLSVIILLFLTIISTPFQLTSPDLWLPRT